MTPEQLQQQAFEKLGLAIYAAVFNSALVDEAVEAFAGTGLRVQSIALTMHITTVPEAAQHAPGCPLAGTVAVQPTFSDDDFLRRLRIDPDLTPEGDSA